MIIFSNMLNNQPTRYDINFDIRLRNKHQYIIKFRLLRGGQKLLIDTIVTKIHMDLVNKGVFRIEDDRMADVKRTFISNCVFESKQIGGRFSRPFVTFKNGPNQIEEVQDFRITVKSSRGQKRSPFIQAFLGE